MTVKDPTETDEIGGAVHSTPVDEAPTFTTRQHLEYLVGLILKEWKKTMVKWHHASGDAVTATGFDELAFYNPDEDSVISFRVDKVPEAIHHKVHALQHMRRIGLPNLQALVELVKEELAKDLFATDSAKSDDGDEISFIGLVSSQPRRPSCVLSSNSASFLLSLSSLQRTDYLRNAPRKRRQDLI